MRAVPLRKSNASFGWTDRYWASYVFAQWKTQAVPGGALKAPCTPHLRRRLRPESPWQERQWLEAAKAARLGGHHFVYEVEPVPNSPDQIVDYETTDHAKGDRYGRGEHPADRKAVLARLSVRTVNASRRRIPLEPARGGWENGSRYELLAQVRFACPACDAARCISCTGVMW